MKLDLQWYDWIFIFFAAWWLPAIVDMLLQSGFVLSIYFIMMLPLYFMAVSVPYFPIYVAYKAYKWAKKRRKVQ